MKNRLIITLILSLIMCQITPCAIVTNNDAYNIQQNNEFVLKNDVYDYYKVLQSWIDRENKVELLRRVASHSELKGYISPNPIDWEHLYDDQDTKATRSNIN